MKIPFVGPSNTARSLNANAERTLNAYLEMDNANPRAPVALYGTPGLTLRATLTSGANRGSISQGSNWYFVAGSRVYQIDSAYTVTDCGAITTNSGRVSMASNGVQVIIVDGSLGWLVTGTTLAQITDVDFPNGVTQAVCIDSYFIVGGDSTQKLYWCETPNSGTAWNGLDFASAEGSPDNVTALLAVGRELWPFGTKSTEIWINTGNADQLFQRSGSAFITMGIASPWTAASMDSTAFWLGSGENGQGIAFKAQGYSPVRISTNAIEYAWSQYSTISDAYAFVYQFAGHSFYVLTFPTANATWVYDAATESWHEWSWRNPADNTDNRHRAVCCAFANGKHLVGDWENGKVYSLESEVYTDNGDPIRFLRRTQTMNEDGAKLFVQGLQVDMETGVANADCADPQLMLRYYKDGHVPSNWKQRSIGQVGQYGKRVKFGPMGSGYNWTWEISITDPVKRAVFGAFAQVEKGA